MIRSASLALVLGLIASVTAAPLPKDDAPREPEEVLKLRREQVKLAERFVEVELSRFETGNGDVTEWPKQLLNARLAVAANREERIAACAKHLASWKKVESISKERFDADRRGVGDHAETVINRIEAEILLMETELRPKRVEVVLKLRTEEIDLAQRGLAKSIQRRNTPGICSLDDEWEWQKRLQTARLGAATSHAERVEACKKYLAYTIEAERLGKSKFEAGNHTIADCNAVIYERFEAEIILAQNEGKPKSDEAVLRFRQEQVGLAQVSLETILKGPPRPDRSRWEQRLLTAQLGAATSRDQRVAVCKKQLDYMTSLRIVLQDMRREGLGVSISEIQRAEYDFLEAKIQLLKEQAKEY